MKRLTITTIILVILEGCSSEDRRIPADIISIDSMKIIVWHLIEAGDYASDVKSKDSTIKTLNTSYFSGVLKLHHLDKFTFVKSFNYYQVHPKFNSILFDSVTAYAQRKRGDMFKIRQ